MTKLKIVIRNKKIEIAFQKKNIFRKIIHIFIEVDNKIFEWKLY